jgi:hypothetical protein
VNASQAEPTVFHDAPILERFSSMTFLTRLAPAAGLFLLSGLHLGADTIRASIHQPFDGVTHHRIVQNQPRKVSIHILEIDPSVPGVRFFNTPSNGDLPGDVVHQTTRAFVAEHGAQIAINANFATYVSGANMNLLNIAASNGDVYSPFHAGWPGINITRDNRVDLVTAVSANVSHDPPLFFSGFDPDPDVELYNTIGGNELILHHGKVIATWADGLHPRTAAGVTAEGKLLLLTIDGRNPGHSLGMSTTEVAQVLQRHGAIHAINLDGGGSTTLIFADPEPRVVNIPVGVRNEPGTERHVGNNLGIYATVRNPSISPRAILMAGASDAPVHLKIQGAPNTLLEVEVSSDYLEWFTLETLETDADGLGKVIDEEAPAHPRRFYRVKSPAG